MAPPYARELAAVLACGPGAILSHRDAAALWGLMSLETRGAVDVTVPERSGRRRPGIRIHRPRHPPTPADRTRRHGVPVTTPARTLLDLAAILEARRLARLTEEAVRMRLVSPRSARAAIERSPAARGAARFAKVLAASDRTPRLTRSAAERRLLELVRAAALPDPEVNIRLLGRERDLVWRRERLVVEVDGFAFHGSRAAFERDRSRDAELVAAGLRVVRVTWRQLEDEPQAVVARLAAALATGRARRSRRAPAPPRADCDRVVVPGSAGHTGAARRAE